MRKYIIPILIFVAILVVGMGVYQLNKKQTGEYTPAQQASEKIVTRSYASVNGLKLYYEIHGEGEPLVLLNGGLCTIESCLGKILPTLAKNRKVITLEQQGHGRTADIDRPLTYEHMADDVVALLQQLKIEKADFFGFSDGGVVALEIASKHPELVRKFVIMGSNYNHDGLHPEVVEGSKQAKAEDIPAEIRDPYMKVAPQPEQWPTLVGKVMNLTANMTSEDIKSIQAPALIIVGDSDNVRLDHAVEMFRLLGGGIAGDFAGLPRSQLAVLPGTTHFMLIDRSDRVMPMTTEFLAAPMPEV